MFKSSFGEVTCLDSSSRLSTQQTIIYATPKVYNIQAHRAGYDHQDKIYYNQRNFYITALINNYEANPEPSH